MTIIRGPRPDSKFVTLDKAISEDARLSWGARGLLVFLLGKPDHWRVSVKHLMGQTENAIGARSGRDAVRGLLGELQQAGYVRAVQARDGNGRLAGTDYIVSEQAQFDPPAPPALPPDMPPDVPSQTPPPAPDAPAPEKPGPAKPAPVEPAPADPHLANTDSKAKTEKEAKKEQQAKKQASKPARVRLGDVPLPADFQPSDTAVQFAAEHGLDLALELSHFKAKAQTQAWVATNWSAKFLTWLRNAVQYAARNGAGRPAARPGQGLAGGASDKPRNYSEGIGDDGSF